MNGYFQLIYNEAGTSIRLVPPTDGGEPLKMADVMEYLDMKAIPHDLTALNSAVTTLQKEIVVTVNNKKGYSEDELVVVHIAPDNMSATVKFYAPSTNGRVMDKDEILNDLKFRNVRFGIKEDVLDAFIANRDYCKEFVIAEGEPAVLGTDARIEYYFNTDLKARPTLKEDGSVDFFNLNTLNACKEGDVIARLFPEQQGTQGTNVLGDKIVPKPPLSARLQFSQNIDISEDRQVLTAKVNGHVSLVDDKVFVSNVLEVENVDNSTGNIDYAGDVQVNGNVCSNFSVRAEGNIEVKGVVEGAHIEAGGNVIIARGMNGMGKGVIHAGGNIISKFIENATATAGGYVESGSILHSKVSAKTEVNVGGKRAFITGGVVAATKSVTVKTLGSSMGADTTIEIGINPELKERHQELQKMIAEAQKTLKSVQPVLIATSQKLAQGIKLPIDQLKYMKSLSEVNKQKTEEVKRCTRELEELDELMKDGGQEGQVVVTGEVYPGTRIVIADVSMVVKSNMQYCRFIRQRGDVKMVGM
ncbi:MAG: DUF342 domain-containing protein [Lachnospiraceae bacterium]|nr:DUF342 domain-containing protein [Lachnospiraceae bacterium]